MHFNGDLQDSESQEQGSRSHRRCDGDGQQVRVVRAVAELAEIVVSPAVGPVVGRYTAAGAIACAHLGLRQVDTQRGRLQAVGGGAVAELAREVNSPAEAPPGQRHAAGVVAARVHLVEVAGTPGPPPVSDGG
jgi:hypothetical protein